MSGVRLTRCNPSLLDFVTWTVLKGCRLFQRVHITPTGLVALKRIPEYDFVAVVPVGATQSVVNISQDASFPLKVSPQNCADELPFFPDLHRGSFVFVAFLAKVLLTGHPRGVQSYLDILPFDQAMPIGAVADHAQATSAYREWIAPVVQDCRVGDADYDLAFRHAYCLYRRHAIPFWTSSESGCAGHPSFQDSPFAQSGCDILGMAPILDLALHSPTPNATIGFPDEEMLHWISQSKRSAGIQRDKDYFVMQAQRDIEEGEVISVNKNAFFGFDDDTFKAWFGYPNSSQVPGEPTGQPLAKEKTEPSVSVGERGEPVMGQGV